MYDMFDIFEDAPDLDVNYDLIAELTERDANAAAEKRPSAASQQAEIIKAAVAKWRKHDKDCGSAEVQVAIAHEKIKYLTKHLLANKHDVSTRRGLQAIVYEGNSSTTCMSMIEISVTRWLVSWEYARPRKEVSIKSLSTHPLRIQRANGRRSALMPEGARY